MARFRLYKNFVWKRRHTSLIPFLLSKIFLWRQLFSLFARNGTILRHVNTAAGGVEAKAGTQDSFLFHNWVARNELILASNLIKITFQLSASVIVVAHTKPCSIYSNMHDIDIEPTPLLEWMSSSPSPKVNTVVCSRLQKSFYGVSVCTASIIGGFSDMCQIHKETDFLIQNHFFHCRYQEKKKENCICHLCEHSLSGNAYCLYGLVISNEHVLLSQKL